MIKRILAWLLIIGFILLIVNILVIGFYRELSIIAYAIVAVFFVFSGGMKKDQS